MITLRYKFQFLFLCCLLVSTGEAISDDNTDLAKESQNPVANLISVPFNSNFNFNYGIQNKTQYILDIKPVVPISMSPKWNLITRTIIPIIHQPELMPSGGYVKGIGDINPSFYISPAHPGAVIVGVGPTFILPTATNKQLGQGKYSVGPSLVVLTMPKSWVIGFLTSNFWSFAGDSSRPNVNSFSLQYFINYNFPHGWFLTSAPVITANWNASSKERWTVPFGIGGGRVFKIGGQALNASIQAYDNVITPSQVGADWQLQLNFSLLFPEKK